MEQKRTEMAENRDNKDKENQNSSGRERSISRMKELSAILKQASRAYYQGAGEIMSNLEYDRLYDELSSLEKQTGISLAGSPTETVGYEVLSALPKERHAKPMLSLDKTKDVEGLRSFLGSQKALISWKLDGLTVVLTYDGGTLVKAVTRGNGEVGEVITPNARVFENIPLRIAFNGHLILRGEAVIGYHDFEQLNEEIPDAEARYKNPRNLCSGSVRQLDSRITAKRHVRFYAFALVEAADADFHNARSEQFDFLQSQGFDVVEHYPVTAETLDERVDFFRGRISSQDIPSDGLVLTYEDIAYGESLGSTAKFPRDSFAFKWTDETASTKLVMIEWSPSRTGLINPVAVFEPVELEGTTVSRASVHNISIMESLELGVGDIIEVYKANMIIPQIADNVTRSGAAAVPDMCPACGGPTQIKALGDVKTLYCTNPDCPVKQIKSFALLTSRDALNVGGLSEATLEKLLAHGFIREYSDLFHLDRYREEICALDGFGVKSYENLQESIEKSRKTTPGRILYSLGIPNVGRRTAMIICSSFGEDLERVRHAQMQELAGIDGIGEVIAESVIRYFSDEKHNRELDDLFKELRPEAETKNSEQIFAGMSFVITGAVSHFTNRDEAKAAIEERGGKVTGSVSGSTSYLVNNDPASGSTKNRKAKELGIPVITEQELLDMMEGKKAVK